MKFQVALKAFSEAIGTVARATGGRQLRPILANILMIADTDELRLVGTDMEIMVLSRIKATVEIPGQCTISAKFLTEVISTLPIDNDKAVLRLEQITEQEHVVILSSGRVKLNLQVQGVEEFPPLPDLNESTFPRFDLSYPGLHKSLKEVSIAMGIDESNPTHRSVCFLFSGGELRLIATDTRRLAITMLAPIAYPTEFERNFLIPGRAVHEILKFSETLETINVGLFKEQIVFTTPKSILITRLYDGRFPDYQRILPKECTRHLTLNNKEFHQALRTVQPLAKNSSQMVHFDVGPNETRIWAESHEEGMSEIFLSTRLDGEPINIAFNGRYFMDFLGVADTDEIVLDMTSPSYPGVLKPGHVDNQFNYVVMPMTF